MNQESDYDPTEPLPRLSSAAESSLEEYLAALRGGQAPVLDEFLERLGAAAERSEFRIVALAESYLLAREQSLDPSLRDTLDRAASEAECRAIRRYIDDSRRAGRLLPKALAAGDVLAKRYRIERELGRGGQAVVYAALDEELGRSVAIKVINSQVARPAEIAAWEKSVRHEARLLANLESRNIVPIYDARAEDQHSFIVMGRVDGIDILRAIEHLREGSENSRVASLQTFIGAEGSGEHETLFNPNSWDRTVARIGCRAAHALAAAHGEGVLHRDLKPQNVMLVGGGEPVLLDFGLAARSGGPESTDDTGFHGTIPYLAPEQAQFYSSGTDPRSDVYQLGLVLYELLTLEPLFVHAKKEPVLAAIERKKLGEFRAPRDVRPNTHPALDAILCKALAAKLEERYSSAEELREDLDRFERGLPPIVADLDSATAAGMQLKRIVRNPISIVACLSLILLMGVYALRTPAWVPPELQPILLSEAGRQTLTPGESISLAGDSILGLAVKAPDPAVLYAFAVSGSPSDSERYLRPVFPEIQGEPVPDPPDFGRLEIAPGDATITCAWFDSGTERHASEGLLVYVCEKPNATLDLWQEQLDASGEGGLFEVSYEEAMRIAGLLFESGSRGDTAASIDPDLRARFLGKTAVPTEEDWQRNGFRRSEFLFPIQAITKKNP